MHERTKKSHIEELTQLMSRAIEVMSKKGARTKEQDEGILTALRLYAIGTSLSSEQYELLSTKIQFLGFTMRTQQYCTHHGALYLGEVFQLRWNSSAYARKEVEEHLRRNIFPDAGDPLAWGWKPPYWKMRNFNTLLNQPLESSNSAKADTSRRYQGYWRHGQYYLGQLLQERSGSSWHFAERQILTADFCQRWPELEPHGCMHVPSTWVPPTTIPSTVALWLANPKA